MSGLLGNRHWTILFGLIAFVVAGCGAGGGGEGGLSTSGGAVNVSLAAVPQDSAGAPLVGTTASDPLAKPMPSDGIDQVWITIHRVALIPGPDGIVPDPSGETSVLDTGSPEPAHVSGDIIPPEEVDLLDLPERGVRFLNAIHDVPAGTYGKIRLYYSDPKVHFVEAEDNTATHPTANYHLDIHFKGGDLVIPVATGGAGDVLVYDVTVYFVPGKDGLKINVNPNKILMRPQVFATLGTVQYVVSGIADNVDKTLSTFDIATAGGRSFHVLYDIGTSWSFRDSDRSVSLSGSSGPPALNDTAFVDVFGIFSASGNLVADDIHIMFPSTIMDNVISGNPTDGWNSDNTITLDIPSDNVVFPLPDRIAAVYDNAVSPFHTLDDSDVVQGATVTARGYLVAGGIEAYWISIASVP
jgi:hypothetical protein